MKNEVLCNGIAQIQLKSDGNLYEIFTFIIII